MLTKEKVYNLLMNIVEEGYNVEAEEMENNDDIFSYICPFCQNEYTEENLLLNHIDLCKNKCNNSGQHDTEYKCPY